MATKIDPLGPHTEEDLQQTALGALCNLAEVCKVRAAMIERSEDPYDKVTHGMYTGEYQLLLKTRVWLQQRFDRDRAAKMSQVANEHQGRSVVTPRDLAQSVADGMKSLYDLWRERPWLGDKLPARGMVTDVHYFMQLWESLFFRRKVDGE